MKLDPNEHTLLASFKSGPEAEETLQALKQAGYKDVQLDRVGRFGYRPELGGRPAIAGKETSLVRSVLNASQLDDESAVLLGASTEASGMSGPSSEEQELPFLITVVTTNDRVMDAVRLIEEHGGRV